MIRSFRDPDTDAFSAARAREGCYRPSTGSPCASLSSSTGRVHWRTCGFPRVIAWKSYAAIVRGTAALALTINIVSASSGATATPTRLRSLTMIEEGTGWVRS